MRKAVTRVMMAIAILLCKSDLSVAFAALPTGSDWARSRLELLKEQQQFVSPSVGKDGEFENRFAFQFEYRMVFNNEHNPRHVVRWIIERDRAFSIVRMDQFGIPIYLSTHERLFLIDSHAPSVRATSIKCRPVWKVDSADDVGTPPGFTTQFGHHVRFDFTKLIQDLIENSDSVDGDPATNTITLSKSNSSRAELVLSRERLSEQFPFCEIRLIGQNDRAVILSGFNIHDTWLPSLTTIRCEGLQNLLNVPENYDVGDLRDEDVVNAIARASGAVTSPSTDLPANQLANVGARTELWKSLSSIDSFSDQESLKLQFLLRRLNSSDHSQVGRTEDADIEELVSFLVTRVVEPVRIQHPKPAKAPFYRHDLRRPPMYLTGYERFRTASRVETCAVPEIAQRLYSVLFNIATDRHRCEKHRLIAMDLLGEIGVPPGSRLPTDLRANLHDDSSDAILTMLAAARVRMTHGTREDLNCLEESYRSVDADESTRLVALEGLLLSDHSSLTEKAVYPVLKQATHESRNLARRCLFAAGCSAVGRRFLLQNLAAAQIDSANFKEYLYLAETSIRASDTEWAELLRIAKSIAVNPKANLELRLKASEIAWYDQSDRSFHDDFIRRVLREGLIEYFDAAGWRYLKSAGDGQRLYADLKAAFDTQSVATRRVIARLIWQVFNNKPSSPEAQEITVDAVVLLAGDTDFSVRKKAFDLYESCRSSSDPSFIDKSLPNLCDVLRHESDSLKFAVLISALARAMRRSLPVNLYYDESTSIRRSEEDTRRITKENRELLQRAVDAWCMSH